ncbi:hypothetical protein RHSIM_Rhsim08G0187900 [Rhododendron simsii]|uniref:CCHC-type domain-containing protein n=1 Tax=Rhododendron simsii TaxID=118357 RepID=A0A834LEN4_RHOSS|nr:hypothetical protein RHSIM_Rhsim08G0187900 [Rhododendron simsii]
MANIEILDLEEGSGETREVTNLCLVGRILSPKVLNAAAISNVFSSVWRTRAPFSMVPWYQTFLFRFEDVEDKDSILMDGPWSIMNNLVIQIHDLPVEKMTRVNAEAIGKRFGRLLAIETSTDGILLGRSFLRVRAEIKIADPFPKGFWLRRETESTRDLWISYKYEKLSDFCYACARLGHDSKGCKFVSREEEGLRSGYGPDLRTGRAKRSMISIEVIRQQVDEAEVRVNNHLSRRPEGLRSDNRARGANSLAERVENTRPNQNLPLDEGMTLPQSGDSVGTLSMPGVNTTKETGIRRTLTSQALSDLMRKNRPSIVFLMETKDNKVTLETICRRLNFDFGKYVEPEGLALWWNNDVSIDVEFSNKNLMHTMIYVQAESICWAASFVYGCPSHAGKERVWNEIRRIACSERVPWMCIGDFNQLKDCGLIDLEYKGPKFTWRNNRSNKAFIVERIVMAFANARWREMFDITLVFLEVAVGSDHNPLILNTNCSLNKTVEVSKMYRLCKKLRGCKERLKNWHRVNFEDMRLQIAILKDKLEEVQRKQEMGFNSDLYIEKKILVTKLADLWQKASMFWHQRSHVDWLRMGDRNSRFFHLTNIQRRQKSQIFKMKDVNGPWQTDPDAIVEAIQDHFQKFPVTMEEVRRAVFQLGPLKAPGSDGFPGLFYQKYWGVVGKDVFETVQNFLQEGHLLREMNHTNVSLIPKVLANGLQPFVHSIITEQQSAFIPGRQIHDNSLLLMKLSTS